MPERLFTAYQVANLLGVTPTEVAQWIQKGWLPFHRLPEGPVRIRERALVQFLRDRGIDLEGILAKAVVREGQTQPGATPAERLSPAAYEHLRKGPAESPRRLTVGELSGVARENPEVAAREPKVEASRRAIRTANEAAKSDLPSLAQEAADRGEPNEISDSDAAEAAIDAQQGARASPGAILSPKSAGKADLEQEQGQKGPATHGRDAHAAREQDGPATHGQDAHAVQEPGAPAMELADLLADALERRATQVLLEAGRDGVRLWLRIDGFYHPSPRCRPSVDSTAAKMLLTQIDATAQASRDASDARIRVAGQGRPFRVIACDTRQGRRVVLQLAQTDGPPSLERMNLPAPVHQSLLELGSRRNGLILFAGPPHSGRHALMESLAGAYSGQRDAVGVYRTREAAGIPTLAPGGKAAFDSLLDQQADVVLLDYLPNAAWLRQATEFALDGGSVFVATAARTLTDLREMFAETGLGTWDLTSAVGGIVFQRQVRELCPHCRRQDNQGSEEIPGMLGLSEAPPAFQAVGCGHCSLTGYAGRMPLLRLLTGRELADALRDTQRQVDVRQGLIEAGLEKVRQGLTSLEEVARAIRL